VANSKISVGWFCYKSQEQYSEFLKIFTDTNVLPRDFTSWKNLADKDIEHAENHGINVIRVYPESAEEFATWCQIHKSGINAEGRTGFASFKASK
jgi:predicted nuclease with RNAse H fold